MQLVQSRLGAPHTFPLSALPPPPSALDLSTRASLDVYSGRAVVLMSVSQKTFTDDSGLPTWEELENAPGTDYKCAWGLFDKDGKKDQTGTLNLLTPARVLNAARSEIRTGDSVSLNWGLENVKFPGFSRKAMSQNVIDLSILGFCGHDDELTFNTQCGSQVSRNQGDRSAPF